MDKFQMLIASTPKGIEMKQELELVKMGLLYADSVTLCSPGAYMLNNISKLKGLTNIQKIKVFLPFVFIHSPHLKEYEEVINLYFHLLESNRATRRALEKNLGRKEIRKVEERGEEIQSVVEDILVQSGFTELERVLNSGRVTLKIFNNGEINDELINEFADFLFYSVKNGVHYPLFDELSGRIVSDLVKQIDIPDYSIKKGNQVRLAQDLFERLPLFSRASVEEILDIRNELERPLRKFRLAMMEFTNGVKNSWWDKDFAFEAERVFYEKIEPAVIEIEEQVEGVSFLKELNINMTVAKGVGGSFVGYLVNGAAASTGLNAAIIGALVAGGASVVDALQKIREQQRVIKNNQMYFYYRLREGFS